MSFDQVISAMGLDPTQTIIAFRSRQIFTLDVDTLSMAGDPLTLNEQTTYLLNIPVGQIFTEMLVVLTLCGKPQIDK